MNDSSRRPNSNPSSNNYDDGNEEEDAIEAEDISVESPPVGILNQLLHRMNPAQCLTGGGEGTPSCHNPLFDEVDIEEIVEHLLHDLKHEGKIRHHALHKLYRLTDRERKHNRYVRSERKNENKQAKYLYRDSSHSLTCTIGYTESRLFAPRNSTSLELSFPACHRPLLPETDDKHCY
jgi:hypothetical protein